MYVHQIKKFGTFLVYFIVVLRSRSRNRALLAGVGDEPMLRSSVSDPDSLESGSGSGSRDPIESGSNPDPDPKHWVTDLIAALKQEDYRLNQIR